MLWIHRRPGREGGYQHLTLKTYVEHPSALGIKAGQAGEEERHREPNTGVEHRRKRVDQVHRAVT